MKKKTLSTLFTTTVLAGTLMLVNTQAHSDGWRFWDRQPGVIPVKNTLYREECDSCHMAYSPGLLPASSWEKVMRNLEDHFGDNAELEPTEHKSIMNYLATNAADRSGFKRSKKIMRSIKSTEIVDRITLTPYFIRKHDEIPRRLVVDNPEVVSLSQCNLCHLNAEKGSFEDDDVKIPGAGYWDD